MSQVVAIKMLTQTKSACTDEQNAFRREMSVLTQASNIMQRLGFYQMVSHQFI